MPTLGQPAAGQPAAGQPAVGQPELRPSAPDAGPAGSPAADVADELGRLIRALNQTSASLAKYQPHGWDKTTLVMLTRLSESGPLRLSELTDGIGLDISTVSRQMQHLADEGLIERRPDPQDRRASLLAVTSEGQRVVEARREERRRIVARMLADWSPAELAEFASYLRRLISAHGEFVPTLRAELIERQRLGEE